MSIIRVVKDKNNPYLMLNTTALNDERLSYRAKGLHAYLMSKPDQWEVYFVHLASQSPSEGLAAIRSSMQELERTGYISRARVRGMHGRMAGWETVIYEAPRMHAPSETDVPPTCDLPMSAKMHPPTCDLPMSVNRMLVSIEERVNIDKTSPLPPNKNLEDISPLGRRQRPVKTSADAQAVLDYLNEMHGRHYRESKQIQTLLNTGRTVEECRLVIQWLWNVERVQNPDGYAKYCDNVTPFRPMNFDRNVEKAKAAKVPHRGKLQL